MGETRDYYADLELPPTADISEIKKQFRKLGTGKATAFEAAAALLTLY